MTEYIKILLNYEDGSVGIMSFITNSKTIVREATDDEIQAEVDRQYKKVVSWKRINEEDIPTDRTFRDAWVDNDGLKVDIEKAKDIQLNSVREERAKLLPDLDVQWSRAIAKNDTVMAGEIEQERQRLRDLPQVLMEAMVNITDPEEIKQYGISYSTN